MPPDPPRGSQLSCSQNFPFFHLEGLKSLLLRVSTKKIFEHKIRIINRDLQGVMASPHTLQSLNRQSFFEWFLHHHWMKETVTRLATFSSRHPGLASHGSLNLQHLLYQQHSTEGWTTVWPSILTSAGIVCHSHWAAVTLKTKQFTTIFSTLLATPN